MSGTAQLGSYWFPRFEAAIPVSLYVNGRVVPPIEADGEIISVSALGLQLKSSARIPIPARGILRFKLDRPDENLELKVNFVQRVESGQNNWFWKSPTTYVMKVEFCENNKEHEDKIKTYFHRRMFGDNHPRITPAESTNLGN